MSPLNMTSRLQVAKARQEQLWAHAKLVQHCLRRVPRNLRQTHEQKQAFEDLREHVGLATHLLSLQEDDEEDGSEPNPLVVGILESQLMSARDMLTLNDGLFGWSLLDMTEDQIMEQVLTVLR